ncbi:hypothetical protein [Bradyrhizobium sp. 5.13L]
MDAAFAQAAYPAYTTAELRLYVRQGAPDADDPIATIAKMTAEIDRREAVLAGDMSRATPGERLRAIRAAEAKPAPAAPAKAWIVARTQAHLHVNGNYSGISVSLTKCRPDDALIAAMNLPPLPKIGAR